MMVQMPRTWMQWQGEVVGGKYELVSHVGGSENSAVFLTHLDSARSKQAVIKLVVADGDKAEHQIDVWNRIKGLSHPHLVRLFGSGKYSLGKQQCLYVVMEHAEEDLSMILPSRALTPEETREMLLPLLRALGYIHGGGFVHGHIKPSNIMVVDEQVKISSDSISEPGSQRIPLQPSAYLAPEAARGVLSPAADVWSLGITLVEALTQQKPTFQQPQGEAILPATMPATFRRIAGKCLRFEPQQRPAIADILAELEPGSSLTGSASSVSPAMGERGVRNPAASSRLRLGPFIATALVLAAFIIGIALHRHSGATLSPPPPAMQNPAQTVPATGTQAPVDSPGKATQQVLPDISNGARRTIQGTIRVRMRISVDASGNVEKIRMESAGPSRYFASKALDAARQWKFDPPVTNGRAVPSEWIVEFQYRRTGITARSARPAN